MAATTWEHIQERHQEVVQDHVFQTIQNPAAIHKDAVKPNGLLVVGNCVLPGTDNALRVAIKTNLAEGCIVQTAHYARDAVRTEQVWPEGKEGENG